MKINIVDEGEHIRQLTDKADKDLASVSKTLNDIKEIEADTQQLLAE